MNIKDLIGRHRDEPGGMLQVLQTVHEQTGGFDEDTLRTVAREFQVPVTDLLSTVTSCEALAPRGQQTGVVRICAGLPCYMAGSGVLLNACRSMAEKEGVRLEAADCPGLCEKPPIVWSTAQTYTKGDMEKVGKAIARAKQELHG